MATVSQKSMPSNILLDSITWGGWYWTDSNSSVLIRYLFDDGGDKAWTLVEKNALAAAMQSWANVANITFQETSSSWSVEFIESLYGDPNTSILGSHETPEHASLFNNYRIYGEYNYLKYSYPTNNNVFDTTGLVSGGAFFEVMIHEIGHGLGLAHPHDTSGGSTLMPGVTSSGSLGDNNLNQNIFTVMSYNDGWTAVQDPVGNSISNAGYMSTPGALDIAVVQHLYGANTTYRSGDDTYVIPEYGPLSTIWDTGGVDQIVYNGNYNVVIDLRPATLNNEVGGGGFVSYVQNSGGNRFYGGYTIAADFTNALPNQGAETGVIIENAWGGAGNDDITGNQADNVLWGRDGNDTIDGQRGDDTLHGNDGHDTLKGGGGNDTLYGGYGNDILEGGAHDDLIYGGHDHDELTGGDGVDQLYGELGNDTFVYTSPWDTFSPDAVVSGGLGYDTILLKSDSNLDIDLRGTTISGIERISFQGLDPYGSPLLRLKVEADFASTFPQMNVETNIFSTGTMRASVVINATSASPHINISNWTFTSWSSRHRMELWGNIDDNDIIGSSVKDVIDGGGGNDFLFAGDGNDAVYAGPGNDTIIGGEGADILYGYTGNDTFLYEKPNEINGLSEFIDGGGGTDILRIESQTPTTLDFRNATIAGIEELEFDPLSPPAFNHVQVHFSAHFVNGSPSLHVDGFAALKNSEEIHIFTTSTAPDIDISNWTFQDWGGQNEMIYLKGDAAANTLIGSSQNDTLLGEGGNDTLRGGQGVDLLYGGDGDDTFVIFSDANATNGELFDGGAGYDKLLLQKDVLSPFNLTGADFVSIEEIEFASEGVLRLDGTDVANGLPADLLIDGWAVTGATEVIRIYMNAQTHVDISGWRFQDWGTQKIFIHGDASDETFIPSSQQDNIYAGSGNDTIWITGNGDFLFADDGDDTFLIKDGLDPVGNIIDGNTGTDTLLLENSPGASDTTFNMNSSFLDSIERVQFASGGTLVIAAGIIGTRLDSALHVRGHNAVGHQERVEILLGSSTKVNISGWTFSNWGAQDEHVRIIGETTDDIITGSHFQDVVIAQTGNDTIRGLGGNDKLHGEDGDDTIHGGTGSDWIDGGTGKDTIGGGDGNDTIYGKTGIDNLSGGSGKDTIYGGFHNDTIFGNGGDDIIHGGDGADTVDGGKHVDEIYGNAGDDTLKGGGGGDTIDGGQDNDTIYGNSGHDVLKGGGGNDTIFGNTGNDDLYGNVGNDILHGGWGYDDLWGGGGADIFIFQKRDWADRVKDFEDNVDIIDLTDWGFASVADALSYATEIKGHVKFDFSSLPGAGSKDYLWVENITIAALQDDILV